MKFIVHESPARRSKSNYIARVDLSPFGFDGEMEQLWLERLDGESFELCCIPFRVYGMALGDLVSVSGDGTTVTGVIRRSGGRVLRVLLVPGEALKAGSNEIKREVEKLGLISEWSGDRHVAVDVPSVADISSLIGVVERGEAESIMFWEWGDATSFSRPQN